MKNQGVLGITSITELESLGPRSLIHPKAGEPDVNEGIKT